MVDVVQLVRTLDCGSRGRRFKSGLPPKASKKFGAFFIGNFAILVHLEKLLGFGPKTIHPGSFPKQLYK